MSPCWLNHHVGELTMVASQVADLLDAINSKQLGLISHFKQQVELYKYMGMGQYL